MKVWVLALLGIVLGMPSAALAFPQFIKDGYFGCGACHISQSGGDLLTPYGRGIAEQKLALASYEGEASPNWGIGTYPTAILLGGHFRRIQLFRDDKEERSAAIFNMQRDLEAGVWQERFAAYATFSEDGEDQWGLRKWLIKATPVDFGTLEVGAFRPRYGLGLNDHNAFVVNNTVPGVGREVNLAQGSLFGEFWEVNIAQSLSQLPARKAPWEDRSKTLTTASASWFALGEHRLNMSMSRTETTDDTKLTAGFSGTLTLSQAWTTSFETNWIYGDPKKNGPKGFASYLDLVWEARKGVWVQPVYEIMLADRTDPKTKIEKQLLRLSLFPRPHFDIKATIGQSKNHSSYEFSNFGSLLFHYWL